jgi:hypothetical protein
MDSSSIVCLAVVPICAQCYLKSRIGLNHHSHHIMTTPIYKNNISSQLENFSVYVYIDRYIECMDMCYPKSRIGLNHHSHHIMTTPIDNDINTQLENALETSLYTCILIEVNTYMCYLRSRIGLIRHIMTSPVLYGHEGFDTYWSEIILFNCIYIFK